MTFTDAVVIADIVGMPSVKDTRKPMTVKRRRGKYMANMDNDMEIKA